MGVEERNSLRFRQKGTQELLVQALRSYSSNEQVTANRQELQALATEAIKTGKWEEVDRVIEELAMTMKK